MVDIDELLRCAFEQDFGKIRKGSKNYKILVKILQQEHNKSVARILRIEKVKKISKIKKKTKPIICDYCDKRIMHDSISYYDPSTKNKKSYHFKCQFHKM